MNVTTRIPQMTREQFLDWAARQEAPFEFDGFEPVAMTGGNWNHALLASNIIFALRKRLDAAVYVLPEAGVATIGRAVRYPDVLVTKALGRGTDRLMPEPLIVFEVVSPNSGRLDRTVKLREYLAVSSIRRYIIVDNTGPDLDVYGRGVNEFGWTEESHTAGQILQLPEVGIELPVDEIFAGVTFDKS